jgi:hypothetical protein
VEFAEITVDSTLPFLILFKIPIHLSSYGASLRRIGLLCKLGDTLLVGAGIH